MLKNSAISLRSTSIPMMPQILMENMVDVSKSCWSIGGSLTGGVSGMTPNPPVSDLILDGAVKKWKVGKPKNRWDGRPRLSECLLKLRNRALKFQRNFPDILSMDCRRFVDRPSTHRHETSLALLKGFPQVCYNPNPKMH